VRLDHPEEASRNVMHETDNDEKPRDNFSQHTELDGNMTALRGMAATEMGNPTDTDGYERGDERA